MHEENDTADSAQDSPAPSPREEQSNMMMDDINIPMVATSVAFFAVLLAVTIISLQAWFYNYQAGVRRMMTLPQESPLSPLGAMLEMQRKELHDAPGEARKLATAGTAPATGTATGSASAPAPKRYRTTVDVGMQTVIDAYAQGTR